MNTRLRTTMLRKPNRRSFTFFFREGSPFLTFLQNLADKCSPLRFAELLAGKLTDLVSTMDYGFVPHKLSYSLCQYIVNTRKFTLVISTITLQTPKSGWPTSPRPIIFFTSNGTPRYRHIKKWFCACSKLQRHKICKCDKLLGENSCFGWKYWSFFNA